MCTARDVVIRPCRTAITWTTYTTGICTLDTTITGTNTDQTRQLVVVAVPMIVPVIMCVFGHHELIVHPG